MDELMNSVAALTLQQRCQFLNVLKESVNQERSERVKEALKGDLGHLSNRAIADQLGFVSDVTVGKIRRQLIQDEAIAV